MGEVSESDTTLQSRKWIATLWLHQVHLCLEETMKNLSDTGRLRFIAYGEEVCPDTGTLHYQAYLVCYKPTRLSQLIKWFGSGHHFEPMYGTLQQNETYCSKEGSFTKLGDEPKQGERHDLIGFKRQLEEGKSPLEVAEDDGHFGTYVKYHTGMEKYASHLAKKKRNAMGFCPPSTYLRVGEPGLGKSKHVFELHPPGDIYTWEPDMGQFFDGYTGQPVVLFEDVQKGQIPPLGKFKRLLDGYPVTLNIKGGSAVWSPKTVYITSNELPLAWYDYPNPSHYEAIMSRIKEGRRVYKDREEVFHTSTRFDGVR